MDCIELTTSIRRPTLILTAIWLISSENPPPPKKTQPRLFKVNGLGYEWQWMTMNTKLRPFSAGLLTHIFCRIVWNKADFVTMPLARSITTSRLGKIISPEDSLVPRASFYRLPSMRKAMLCGSVLRALSRARARWCEIQIISQDDPVNTVMPILSAYLEFMCPS